MKLSRREIVFVGAGLLLALIIVAAEGVFRPLWSKRQALSAGIARSERQLRQMQALLERHRRYTALLAEVEGRLIRKEDDFSLFSFLEEAAGRAGIRRQLVAMNPSESAGEGGYRRLEMLIQFEDLTMDQMVRYLEEVSKAPRLLRVSRLSMERSAKVPGRVRVTVSVVAFTAREKGAGAR